MAAGTINGFTRVALGVVGQGVGACRRAGLADRVGPGARDQIRLLGKRGSQHGIKTLHQQGAEGRRAGAHGLNTGAE